MIQQEITETSVEELTYTLNLLETNLEEFKQKIEPELNKLGYNIAYTSFKFSSNMQLSAMNNYDKVINGIYSKGYYTAADLNSLDNSLRMQNVAQQAMIWGSIISGVVILGGKLIAKAKEYFVKKKMIGYIDQERNRFYTVEKIITESTLRLNSNYKIKRSLFEKIGLLVNTESEAREKNMLNISNLVNSFKKYSETKYRMEYILDVYNTLNNFDYDEFKSSLKNLLFVSIQKKVLYSIKSSDYVQELELLLNKSDWDELYYKSGLPDIVIYCLRNRKNQDVFPHKYKCEILNEIIKKIRKETFFQLNPVAHFASYKYCKNNYIKPGHIFRYHIVASICLILILIPLIFYDNISGQQMISQADTTMTSIVSESDTNVSIGDQKFKSSSKKEKNNRTKEIKTDENKNAVIINSESKFIGYLSNKQNFALFSEPEGYYVQIGSYKNKNAANEKLKFLKEKNIKGAVFETDLKEKGVIYRVRAGAFKSQEKAREVMLSYE